MEWFKFKMNDEEFCFKCNNKEDAEIEMKNIIIKEKLKGEFVFIGGMFRNVSYLYDF